MKRSKGMFWGLLFLVVGAILLIQHVFQIDLPILKILFGCWLIYMGFKVLFGSFGLQVSGFKVNKVQTADQFVFSEGDFQTHSGSTFNRRYSSAFSSTKLDLSNLSETELKETVHIDSAFGNVRVKTNPSLPISATTSIAFGSVKIRGAKQGSLGNTNYQSPGFKESEPHLNLNIDCAFGDVTID